jgi:DNA-binding CsgD family transcriptional regulator
MAALARGRRDSDAHSGWLDRAEKLITIARDAAAEAAAITPNAAGWLALAEAEYERVGGAARPELWSEAARIWDGSNAHRSRPTAAGARPRRSSPPARPAPRPARRSAKRTPSPLTSAQSPYSGRSNCSPNARGSISRRRSRTRTARGRARRILGLTPREPEVLTLVARGYTNREIAAALVISVKTASVHVSHILRKLDAPNRLEAAAIAHRLALPGDGQPSSTPDP